MSENTLLICSVGGSPEPIVGSLIHWRPARVVFIVSPESKSSVMEKIIPLARTHGFDLSPGAYEFLELPDSQDFAVCVRRLPELNLEVERWQRRGEGHAVVVDYTGGTKTMTAALVLHAHHWPCRFSYVGGGERTKGGVGIVVSGTEKVLFTQNPWDALGYQSVESFVVLFDQHAYSQAAESLHAAVCRVSDPARKRELSTLKTLAEAYAAWDRFDHKKAVSLLITVQKNANDFRPLMAETTRRALLATVDRHVQHLTALQDCQEPNFALVLDLLANAHRRASEGRFDDAVGRLYRAVEATAQFQLRQHHGIANTGNVRVDQLPQSLQTTWQAKSQDGVLKLALQDAFLLLRELGDALGDRFGQLGWHDPKHSPLVARNSSILAHGFTPVKSEIYEALWQGCLTLAGVSEEDLPTFPQLASRH